MTALSSIKPRNERLASAAENQIIPMYTQKIWAGALVMVDANGYARNAAALASNKGCAGVAAETKDNSAGSSGDLSIKVKSGRFLLTGTGFTAASVGAKAYASDNDTISTTQGTNEPLVGVVTEYVSATQVWVQVGPIAQTTAT